MAATERDVQEQVKYPEIPTLQESILRTLHIPMGKNPGFFQSKSPEDPVPYVIEGTKQTLELKLAELLHCVGFGKREQAEAIFKDYPALLLWRGELTDITNETYPDITAFEYAVKVNKKDSRFVRKVVDFLETWQGKDRNKIVADLLEQFDKSFSDEPNPSVTRFLNASRHWLSEFKSRTWDERDRCLVQDVGEAQALFPAIILQEYCRNGRSFNPTPKFNEPDLPEGLLFYNCCSNRWASLLNTSPGDLGNFALIRGRLQSWADGRSGGGWVGGVDVDLEIDCAAVDALDKVQTADLHALRARLVSILTPVDSPEPHAQTLVCSSSVSL